MNYYPSGSNLETGYSDTQKWNTTLLALGWQSNHILIHQGLIDQQVGLAAFDFLFANVDTNDVVLWFVFAHGNYLLENIDWQTWFPDHWTNLQSQEKIFIASACSSEFLIQSLSDDGVPHVYISSSEADEYSWAGLPEEGLPIIGEVFNHFLTNALLNASADSDTDGEVTMEEAFFFAAPLSRSYISTIVFPAFPDFAEMCNNTAPNPVMDDTYEGNFSLLIEDGAPPIMAPWVLPIEVGIIIGFVCVIIIILITFALVIQRRKIQS
ncbi:MAG: hypothetical protein ACFFCJ_03300 [Promethearchaeota archaeon]